jgi:exopolysaccharide biosynthesis polyprenyl glycosylphosphotransferase
MEGPLSTDNRTVVAEPDRRKALAHERRGGITAAIDERTIELIERRRSSRFKRRGWLIRRLLLLADVFGLTFAYFVSELAIEREPAGQTFGGWADLALFVAFLPIWVVVAKLYGLYDRDEERADYSTADDLAGVFILVTLISWLYLVGAIALGFATPDIVRLTLFWGAAVPLITFARVAVRGVARLHPVYVQNTVIVGAGNVGQIVARKFLNHPEYGVNVAGFIDSQPRERRGDLEHLTLLGSPDQLLDIVNSCMIERVVIAFSTESDDKMAALVRSLDDMNVQVDVVPRLFDVVGSAFDVHSVEGLPLMGLRPPRLSRSSILIKRTIDVLIATTGLVLLTPIFLLTALAIRLNSPGPVFFRQLRMGANGRTFYLYKFRTMIVDAESRIVEFAVVNKHAGPGGDPRMFKGVNDPRVTRVGRILRRFSIDELPQLINVVMDDMSLVGPRPLIIEEDRHVKDWARRRLDIKPGITGPWQVLGRSEIPFGEMVLLDYQYVTRWSLYEDVKLLLRTLPAVLRRRGSY